MDALSLSMFVKMKRQEYELSIEEEEESQADVDQTTEIADSEAVKWVENLQAAKRQGTEGETPIQENQASEYLIKTSENSTMEELPIQPLLFKLKTLQV